MNIRVIFARRLLSRHASGSLPFWKAHLTNHSIFTMFQTLNKYRKTGQNRQKDFLVPKVTGIRLLADDTLGLF